MQALIEQTERLAARIVATTADDLNALADLHTQLQSLTTLPEAAEPTMKPLRESAGRMEKLIEQIILREVKDADAALKKLTVGFSELQTLASGGTVAPEAEPTAAAE